MLSYRDPGVPHHRKDPSYYPLLAHVTQTGHILRVKNRPGNVHDSKQSVAFLREVIAGLRTAFGRRLPLEFRMGAAFCQRAVFRLLAARGCAYAVKVGYWKAHRAGRSSARFVATALYSKWPPSGVKRSSWKFLGLSWPTCLR